ncbi:DUF502 domain-containing protein [Geoglobus acetivorans]|uniref:DUF502 domain-containing protein n=1 Tax=Geoglobus acetivorans TaxID=565033 RepID=A0ABZ3H2M3_GEOAI|nr:DUF502 domain-containing protein [Geoglobus acetivorans]
MERLRRMFITGVVIFLPLAATFLIIYWAVGFVEDFLRPFASKSPYYFPGMSLVILALVILGLGFVGTRTFGQRMIDVFEGWIKKIPLIRTIYVGTKEALRTLLQSDIERLKGVVLVEYPRKGMYALGFTSGTKISQACESTGKKLVNVFVPTSPNPTSGFVILVPEEELVYLDMSVEDAMKVIISGGFSQ